MKAANSPDADGKDASKRELARKNKIKKDEETKDKLSASLRNLFKPCNIEFEAEDQDKGQQNLVPTPG